MPAVLEQPFFTRDQIRRRYQVTYRTIQNWEEQGILRPVRIGGIIRYPAENIEALEASSGQEAEE